MEKTLFIHIGGPKTGTTALQDFLSQNRRLLRSLGFFYPGEGQAHREICDELAAHAKGELQSLYLCFSRWMNDMERSPCQTHILSAECFSYSEGAKKLRELIPPAFKVTVVYYARRQDLFIESWYNQVVKSRDVRLEQRLDADLVTRCYGMREFDHMRVITPWAQAFGKENVTARCYEEAQMTGGIIEDFSTVIGLPVDNNLWIPPSRVNKSLDVPLTEFLRLCNQYLPEEREINRFLYWTHFKNSRIYPAPVKRYLLSPEKRIEILNHYEVSNQQFAREYLGREDGRLFYEPWPDPAEPWEEYRGLSAEELAPIVTEMIVRQAMRERADQPLQALLGIANRMLKKIPFWRPSGCPAAPCTGTAELQKSGTAEELVPLVAKIVYERERQMREQGEPLSRVLRRVNLPFAKAAALLPVLKRKRLGRRLAGGAQENG